MGEFTDLKTAKTIRHTKLDTLLEGKGVWDDATWFQAERYLASRFARPGALMFVSLCGVELEGAARYFKTDALKLLRGVQPQQVLATWHVWQARHR